jgi:2-deoxy-D-gluconate 3-dehydrogenase
MGRLINANLLRLFPSASTPRALCRKTDMAKSLNFASLISFFGGHSVPSYAASKGGYRALTKTFSKIGRRIGINVNAKAPGYTDTRRC